MAEKKKKKSLFRRVVGGVGDVVSKAAPLATFIPGVGPIAAGALGLAGGLAGELNDDDGIQPLKALKSGAWGAGGAYGLDKLAGMSGLATKGAGQLTKAAGLSGGGGSVAGDLIRGVTGFARDNAGLLLGGAAALQGARQGQRANNLQDDAIEYARSRDGEAKQYRDLAFKKLSAMDLAERPNVAGLIRDPLNPYARAA